MLLKEIVEKNHYRFADSFSSWKEDVYGACEPLLEDGIIDENYPQAIIRNVETYGPYFVILPAVAMPDAGKGTGVSGTAICFVKVKEAVVFDEKDISKRHLSCWFRLLFDFFSGPMESLKILQKREN